MRTDRIWKKSAVVWLLCAVCLMTAACSSAGSSAGTDSGEAIDLNAPDAVIAAEVGTTTESDARSAYPNAQIVYVNSATDGLLAVTSGKVDAYAMNLTAYESSVESQRSDVTLHPDGVVGTGGDVAVGISPVTELSNAAELINGFIAEIKADGTLDDMNRRWETEHDYTMPEIPVPENPDFTIRVGTTGAAEPYSFYQDNELVGFDLELMYRFALWCNAELIIDVYDWYGIMPACTSGKVDYIMSNLFATEERREAMDFSDPYKTVRTVMVVANAEAPAEEGFLDGIRSSFEKTFIRENRWQMILSGLLVTLEISLLSGILGTALGFGLCLLLRSRRRAVSGAARVFCRIMEGVPNLVVLLIVNFVIFASSDIEPIAVAVISFSVIFAVAVAGTLNTGINAVDSGQWEAASALGFGRAASFLHVVLPQAVRHVLPIYKSEVVSMIKMTSIVGYISIQDLARAGDLIRSRTFEAFFPLIATAVIYFAISSAVAGAIGRIELNIDPRRRPRRLPKGVVAADRPAAPAAPSQVFEEGELIRIEHLKKAFPNVTPLTDVNTSIHRGEVITIIGPSGTGKSTLLRCVNRLETPSSGAILVHGENICDKKADLNALRRRMGMVFQQFNLFDHLTIIENIMLAPTLIRKMPRQEAYEKAMGLLKAVGMTEKALSYPDELSGGQKQRAAIARTLAMEPEIVLFTKSQVLSSFLKQFYAGTPFIPKEIMLQTEVEDREVIEEWLSSRRKQRVHIIVPKKGTKEKLVELARENARMVLDKDRERIKREEGRTIGLSMSGGMAGAKGIVRMEAFDISNISGFESVGSMVVYEKGRPKKSDYRKFRIKSVQGPNDYASMEEVLTRRFTHETSGEFDSFARMPDLLLMDGGRGRCWPI